ncbi:MAG: histidinol phosphate phosphatase domain-containing protein [Chloroflexi bacterium]|nr:histidinol phosphate phosphatase domain-containing protein [Chloroflexota bacterium]
MYDFHTHTYLSDGVLSPIELIRRAYDKGYRAIAITDHVGLADQERIIPILVEECAHAAARWEIIAIPGVELTHVPVDLIPEAARRAKALGARLIVVHGETIVEPVEPGTNKAALSCAQVDVLAHPGLLTEEEGRLAAHQGVYLELSARRGHALANGHVAHLALRAGAALLLDSDAHAPEDLLSEELASRIVRGAGLDVEEADSVRQTNPGQLLRKLGYRLP